MSDPVEQASNFFSDLGDAGSSLLDSAGNVVDNFLKDPLPTIETIALTYYLGPEGAALVDSEGAAAILASATVSAANGGNMEQIATAAATAYLGGEIGKGVGAELPEGTSKLVKQVVTSASGSAAVTALQGGSLKDVLTSGLSASIGTYVTESLAKEGYSKVDKQLISNATSAATKAVLKGTSVADAIGASVASTLIRNTISGDITKINENNEIGKGLQKTYDSLYTSAKDMYDEYIAPGVKYLTERQGLLETNRNLYNDTYAKFETSYKSYLANKDGFENYETHMKDMGFRHIVQKNLGIDSWMDTTGQGRTPPTKEDFRVAGNADAKDIKEYSATLDRVKSTYNLLDEGYQKNLKIYNGNLGIYNEDYKAPLDAAEKDITDLNDEQTKLVKSVGENVIKYEDQLSTDAAAIAKSIGEETVANAKNELGAINEGFQSYADKQDAGTDKPADYYAKKEGYDDAIEKIAAQDAGFTDAKTYNTATDAGFSTAKDYKDASAIGASTNKEYKDKLDSVNKEFNTYLGRDATSDEIKSVIDGGTNVEKTTKDLIAPNYTDKDEVNKIFQDNLGRDATEQELNQFVGATSDADTKTIADQYIAPLYTTKEEVNQMVRDQLGRDATPEEIARYSGPTSNTDSEKIIASYSAPLKTTEDEVVNFFKENVGREPTAAEVAKFVGYTPDSTTLTQKNVEDKLINGLDLPEDYKFPDLKTEVKFADAFSAARAAYGPNATFTWTDPKTGVERSYLTSTADEVKKSSVGDYDALTYKYVTKQMLDRIDDPNFNPADLTKSEMNKFIENFSNSTPEQRQRLLTGSDAMTYKAINSMLGQALPNAKFTPDTVGTGTLKESDLTNYSGILKAATNTAAADIAGLAVRGVQAFGDVFGMDTDTLRKAQDLLTKDKDTMMSKLVGNERAVAGGLASGIESAISYTLGGPAAAIGSLTGIAANNAWIEGEKAGLSTLDNAQRTAVMATLEAAGEAVGIPGLSRLMKGVPAGATTDQIIAYVKNAGLAMGNEQVSELATTAAQFAVDKWASYGLGKNATLSDFADAMKDTAVSTVFAVGSSGSIGAATNALRNTSTAPTDVIRTEVTPEVAWKRATDAGMSAEDMTNIEEAVKASINNGDMTTTQAKDAVIADLQDLGFTSQEASRIANSATADVVESTVSQKLVDLNVPSDQLDALSGAITDQIMSGSDLKTSVNAVGQELQKATGMDSTESLLAANTILTGMDVTKEVGDTLSKYNYDATPDQINKMILDNVGSNKSGLATNVVESKASDILKNSGLSDETIVKLAPTIASSVISGEALDTSVKTIADQIAASTGSDALTASIIANEALTGSNIKSDINSELESVGYKASEQELNDLISDNLTTSKTDLNTKVDEYIDPRYVDQQEALTALNQNLATQITPAQLAMLTGQYSEAELPEKAIASALAGNLQSEQEAEDEKKAKAAAVTKAQGLLSAGTSSAPSTAKQFGQPSVPGQTSSTTPLAVAGMLAPTFLSSKGIQQKFEGPLEEFQRLQDQPYAGENQYEGIAPNEPTPEQTPMNDAYYNYGQNQSIDQIMSPNNLQNTANPDWMNAANQNNVMQPGGLVANMYAAGGATGTRHGKYAQGGLSTPLMAAGGKLRVDFRHGDAVTGPGDGQSDDIPAMLADGEFVFPADVVAAIGNGSTKAGSDKLYDMMHGIRAHARSTHPKELPPEIKSPLDFLKTKPRKAGRK